MVNRDKVRLVGHYFRCAQDALQRALDGLERWVGDESDRAYVTDQVERISEEVSLGCALWHQLNMAVELERTV